MLFAMGAGPRVIGVGNFDRYPPEALTRTKVGGLIDPDVERIISLKPDLVVVYGTQSDLRTQMERAHIPIFLYQHSRAADITADHSRARQHESGTSRRAATWPIASRRRSPTIRKRVAGRPRPRTLLVFGRDAETLRGIYASGGRRLPARHARGCRRHQRVRRREAPEHSDDERACLARAPEVIVEIGADTASSKGRNVGAWDALGSVPAVRTQAHLSS